MSRLSLPVWLNLALVAVLACTAWTVMTSPWFPLGVDAMQFYGAGELVALGEADRLYDQPYFQSRQEPLAAGEDCSRHFSFYPPAVALFLAPWASLPYLQARGLWWIAEGLLFLAAGLMVYRSERLPPRWRLTAVLALSILMPVWMAMRVGQMTPVWLVAVLGGFLLHERQRPWAAGLVLSILAMKPQLAVPLAIWLMLRRDWRTLAGMFAGAAVQNVLVAVCLGPSVLADYFRELPNIMRYAKLADYSPAYEQSIAGTFKNLLLYGGLLAPEHRWAAMLIQPLVVVAAGAGLYTLVRAAGRLTSLGEGDSPIFAGRKLGQSPTDYEYAAAALFLVISTPHLLLYDAGLLAVAIVYLWRTPDWKLGVLLLASMTTSAAIFYYVIGLSLMPLLAIAVLFRAVARVRGLERGPVDVECLRASGMPA